ncbi:MAG: aldehyde ferredoxin oxidoreductase family protein [Anaerolineae bacterium]|nr:aldehyde ferredoxin oxidoreductase family protein [Anaerolineae bacterium]
MPFGYHGKILRVDLTHHAYHVEEPSDAFYRHYGGGSAIGLYYLLREMPANADPLGPENLLVLSLSPLTGAPISGQSRMMANAKSPLTGAIGDSQCGGFFPAQMKFAGFDALVLRGQSPSPVYLWIKDGEVEIRDARHLWGKITGDAEKIIRQELGDDKIEIAQIGPAGEKLARFAAIMNMSNRANGRTGMGAVMGSKNLKAIAVRGTRGANVLEFADKPGILRLTQYGAKDIPNNPSVADLGKFGTSCGVPHLNLIGSLPAYNFDSGSFASWEKISGETMYDTILRGAEEGRQNTRGRDTCYSCAVRCKRVVETEYQGHPVDPHYGGPEYETIATFGSYCGIDDLNAIALASQLCNQYGVDTISAGATIAFAFDCYKHGILTSQDTGGLELKYGNVSEMLALTEQMLTRTTPLGDLLAEGSARAAKQIGRGAEELVITVKGLELPAHTPQAKRSLGLIYAVNPYGADHMAHEHDPAYEQGNTNEAQLAHLAELGLSDPQPEYSLNAEKIRYAYLTELFYSALDSFGLCQFVYGPAWSLFGPNQTVEFIRAATGWEYSVDELMQVGARRLNMMRAFNAREGIDRAQDQLPKKMFKPFKGGGLDGYRLSRDEIEYAKDLYYEMAGWNVANGTPTRQRLAELGIEWVADLLEPASSQHQVLETRV